MKKSATGGKRRLRIIGWERKNDNEKREYRGGIGVLLNGSELFHGLP